MLAWLINLKFKTNYFNLSYRLAPEFPYPAAINDCYSVTNYILSNPNQFNADKDKFILAGDSSGNLNIKLMIWILNSNYNANF